ncbi:MAG: aminotransferase class I/II-fold pyridoxal phosphate-dependent enzyme [Candidatus Bathyarchaeia archaeon]
MGRIGIYGRARDSYIDFSVDTNPFALELWKNFVVSHLDITNYPPLYPYGAESILSNVLGIPCNSLCLIPDSIFGIYLTLIYFKPKRVVVPFPTFKEYLRIPELFGIPVKKYYLEEEEKFYFCLGSLPSVMEEHDLLIVPNPNNPTGSYLDREKVKALVRMARYGNFYVVFDEAFIDFAEPVNYDDDLIGSDKALFLRSFTKIFSIPGIRLGVFIGNSAVLEVIRKLVPIWSITNIALSALDLIVKNWFLVDTWRVLIEGERVQLMNNLMSLGFKVFPSRANYVFAKAPFSSVLLAERLIQYNIVIKTYEEFEGYENFFRVSVKSPDENMLLIKSIKRVMEHEGL